MGGGVDVRCRGSKIQSNLAVSATSMVRKQECNLNAFIQREHPIPSMAMTAQYWALASTHIRSSASCFASPPPITPPSSSSYIVLVNSAVAAAWQITHPTAHPANSRRAASPQKDVTTHDDREYSVKAAGVGNIEPRLTHDSLMISPIPNPHSRKGVHPNSEKSPVSESPRVTCGRTGGGASACFLFIHIYQFRIGFGFSLPSFLFWLRCPAARMLYIPASAPSLNSVNDYSTTPTYPPLLLLSIDTHPPIEQAKQSRTVPYQFGELYI
ncbi:hypothetical protein B0H13DRAFT_1884618 [Mycena leptocephala]|nr:hypothetical protein B0H13DRAFT_1884618 [Mycena leptocephala]